MADITGVLAQDLIEFTAAIVSAFVSKNAISPGDLPKLVGEVHGAHRRLSKEAPDKEEPAPAAAVSIRKSITPDYLICLDDGKKFKTLKRHLRDLEMTPQDYRDKWKLPHDYPMVASNYSAKRSALALTLGLAESPVTRLYLRSGQRRWPEASGKDRPNHSQT